MNKILNIAHWSFMISMVSWIITMAVTPVGGWSLSNPYREYYMNTFCITGILTLITLFTNIKLLSNDSNNRIIQ